MTDQEIDDLYFKFAETSLNRVGARQFARALISLAAGEWKTIETAPKDKWILAYRPQRHGGQSSSLVWVIWDEGVGMWTWPTDSTFDIYTDDFFEKDGRGRLIWDDSYQDDSFTHWMPLPSAPSVEGEGA